VKKRILSFMCTVLMFLTGCTQANTSDIKTSPTTSTTNKTIILAQTTDTTKEISIKTDNTSDSMEKITEPISALAIQADFVTETSNDVQFGPRLTPDGANCFFNEHEVITAENNPGSISSAEVTIDNNFAWEYVNGTPILMILIDPEKTWQDEDYLTLPKYGHPLVSKYGSEIDIIWTNPDNTEDEIFLEFQVGDSNMRVHVNSPKGINNEDGYTDTLVTPPFIDGTNANRVYVPLYAILYETGGGVLYDPLGEGSVFIYSGDAITGYTGMWETSDRGEYRTDVVISGQTYSISSYWNGLELKSDGTFTESDRFYQDGGEWVLTEKNGHYAFFGRILAMKYETESEYRGTDYNALIPCRVNELSEGWGKVTGACVYARFIDEWDEGFLQIHGWNPMYSNMVDKGEAAPRPGKATQ